MKSRRAQIAAVLVAAGAAVALVALSPGSGSGSGTVHRSSKGAPQVLTGSIVQTDKQWVCSGPVALDSVTVTMDAAAQQLPRTGMDAVHLESGCTGTIGSITIVQYAADGIKVGNGAHDLTIGGGSIRCYDKAPTLHQDGIQVMSGVNITFQNMSIYCGRPGGGVINSEIFFNKGLDSTIPPTNVVCDSCQLGPNAAHTVLIQDSIASGVRNTTLCPARYRGLALTIGSAAQQPVNENNQLPGFCEQLNVPAGGTTTSTPTTTGTSTLPANPGRLTIATQTTLVTEGASLLLSGSLVSGRSGRLIDVYELPFGAAAEKLAGTTRTDSSGRWQFIVHPRIATSYSAQARSFASPSVAVKVRPVITTRYGGRRLTVKVVSTQPLTGRHVFIQRFVGGRWASIGSAVLGPHSGVVVTLKPTGAKVRVSLPAAPGYVAALSAPVTV